VTSGRTKLSLSGVSTGRDDIKTKYFTCFKIAYIYKKYIDRICSIEIKKSFEGCKDNICFRSESSGVPFLRLCKRAPSP
jgi:hypothetical protein